MHARTPLPVSRSRYRRGLASRRRTPARCRTAAKRATTIVANSHQRRCCIRNGQRQGTARCPDEIRSARTAWHCASRLAQSLFGVPASKRLRPMLDELAHSVQPRRSDLRRSDVRTEYPRIPLARLRVAYVDLAQQTGAQTSTRIFRSIGAYSSIVADYPIALNWP